MEFWQALWTAVWFAGLGIFVVLSVIVVIEGGKDLRALLRGMEEVNRTTSHHGDTETRRLHEE